MSKWYFKDKDRILMILYVEYDKFVFEIEFPEDLIFENPMEQVLCYGIEESLVYQCEDFEKFKKFFINDYHFEKAVE